MPKTIAMGLTHAGTVRTRNEDAFFLLDKTVAGRSDAAQSHAAHAEGPIQFFAIADGMGGRGVGDAAAQAALNALDVARRQIRQPDRFEFQTFARDFLQKAAQAVQDVLQNSRGLHAGASMTLLCLTDESGYVLSLGNCRCYRMRDGRLSRLTEDDIMPDTSPRRLSRYLGQPPGEQPAGSPQVLRFDLCQEDQFLLTSDGFSDAVDETEIAAWMSTPSAFAGKPGQMMDRVLTGEARDNVTFLLLRVLDPACSVPDSVQPARPARHRPPARFQFRSGVLRAILILIACVLTGFVAGLLVLTLFF